MDSDSKLPSSEIKAQVLRDVDEGRISTNAVELIAACSALLQMSGGKEASEKKGVDDTSSPVHDQQVFSNNATLLKSNAFNQKDACTASAGAAPGDLNTVSPVAQPNFVNFHEPLHAEMEAGESSVRQPRSKTRRKRSSKETLWMKNYRELQEFKAEHGHTNVPLGYSQNPSLGNWVKYNRQKMREWDNSCSEEEKEKMKLLVEIGMMSYIGKGNSARVSGLDLTSRQVQAWEMQFTNLCNYKEEYGDCDVPTNEIGKWKTLGEWVKRQRKVYRKFHSSGEVPRNLNNKYLIERFDRLKKIGFRFRIGSGTTSGSKERRGIIKGKKIEQTATSQIMNLASGNHLVNGFASFNKEEEGQNNLTARSEESHGEQQLQVEVTNYQRPVALSSTSEVTERTKAAGPNATKTIQQTSFQQHQEQPDEVDTATFSTSCGRTLCEAQDCTQPEKSKVTSILSNDMTG